MSDEIVPVLPRLGGHSDVGDRGLGGCDTGGAHHAHGPVEAVVGDQEVRSASDEQHAGPLLTAESHLVGAAELEQLLAGLGDGHLRGRTAEAEGGELRQLLAHGSAHRLIRTWVRLRTSASPDFTVMSMRAVPTAASTAPTVAVSLSEVVGDVGGPASASGTSTGAENRVR